jgi:hypothetical protein
LKGFVGSAGFGYEILNGFCVLSFAGFVFGVVVAVAEAIERGFAGFDVEADGRRFGDDFGDELGFMIPDEADERLLDVRLKVVQRARPERCSLRSRATSSNSSSR